MPANFNPIYARTPDLQVAGAASATAPPLGPTALAASDGTGASGMYAIYQADATEGSFVQKVILKPISSGSGTTAATVIRLYYHRQTTFTVGTNNGVTNTALIAELSTSSWTYSSTTASPQYEIPINMPMNPGTWLTISFGTATGASQGYNPVTIAGKY